tara:strand:- start:1463 stop:1678 length:216 start_codon:yes stop_codon:yes gene_type:complete
MMIGEVSEKSGVSIDTLRFYEKIGLIDPPIRSDAGRRIYGPDARAVAQLPVYNCVQHEARYMNLQCCPWCR